MLCPFFLALEGVGFQLINVFLLMIGNSLKEFTEGHFLDFPDIHEVRMLIVSHDLKDNAASR